MKTQALHITPDRKDQDEVCKSDRPDSESFLYLLITIGFSASDLRNTVLCHEHHNDSSYYVTFLISFIYIIEKEFIKHKNIWLVKMFIWFFP